MISSRKVSLLPTQIASPAFQNDVGSANNPRSPGSANSADEQVVKIISRLPEMLVFLACKLATGMTSDSCSSLVRHKLIC